MVELSTGGCAEPYDLLVELNESKYGFDDVGELDRVMVQLGRGSDIVRTVIDCTFLGTPDVVINAGPGNDEVSWFAETGDFKLHMGSGDDSVFRGGIAQGDTFVSLASGDDEFATSFSVFQGRFRLHAGSGDDFVGLSLVTFDQQTVVKLGGGQDSLNLNQSIFKGPVMLNGQGGSDTLNSTSPTVDIDPRITSFEIINAS